MFCAMIFSLMFNYYALFGPAMLGFGGILGYCGCTKVSFAFFFACSPDGGPEGGRFLIVVVSFLLLILSIIQNRLKCAAASH